MDSFLRSLSGVAALVAAGAGVSGQVVNGGFESGDLAGWTVSDVFGAFVPVSVGGAGDSPGYGLFATTACEGSYSLRHGFDGMGPGAITLWQEVAIDGSPLTFNWQSGADLASHGATLGRTFRCDLEPAGGGAPVPAPGSGIVHVETAGVMNPGTGLRVAHVDVSAYVGQTMRIRFTWGIPESLSGPGWFELDNVFLGDAGTACVPPPTLYVGDYGWRPIVPDFLDVAATGTDVTGALLDLDDGGVVVPLGFPFLFYAELVDELLFDTNGYLTAGTTAGDFSSDCPLSSPTEPNRGIYPFWDDLSLSEHGALIHETVGAAPERVFVAQWEDVGAFSDSAARLTFQVQLFESTGAIEFHYDELVSGPLFDASGGTAAIGIESSADLAVATEIAACVPGAATTTTGYRIAVKARQTPRAGAAPNAGTLSAPAPPIVGRDWLPTVASTLPSPALDVVFVDLVAPQPIEILVPFGTFLSDPPSSAGVEVFVGPAGQPIVVPVPLRASLTGFRFSAQGASIQLPLAVELTNALDCTVGVH